MNKSVTVLGLFCIVVCIASLILLGGILFTENIKEGKQQCFTLEDVLNSKLVNNYIQLEKNKTYNMCLVIISIGLSIGLILHGLPFRFDFRRSTVYTEYSEDDEDDGEDE